MNNLVARIIVFFLLVGPGALYGQSTYQKPELNDPESWTIVLLPDVQSYVKNERNQPILDLMMFWITSNMEKLNIQLVLATGDLVDNNDSASPDLVKFDQPGIAQWEAVSRSFDKLNGKLPYITATGNHDYSYAGMQKKNSGFKDHFPANKNFLNQKIMRAAFPNTEGIPTAENAIFEFTSPNDEKYLVVNIEFGPRDTVVQWAHKIVNQKKYKDHRIILLTHSYLSSNNQRITKSNYPVADKNEGEAIWQKLVQSTPNIELVVCGHIASPDDFKKHTGFCTDKNNAGKNVHQMLFNAQALGGGWHGNGGDGWLRILEFLPDGKTVKVKTFSPLFAISPTTQQYAWEKAAYNEFEFKFD
ncbi:MAG: metallophosphoesterase [Bacteroidales bacterium]|jgi:hypothetical protein|nr:metallophosphoesterase [Bacteroidales bacterium]